MVACELGFCQEPRFRLANLHLQSQSSRYEAGSQLRGRRSIFVGPSAPENSNYRVLLTCARKAKPARMVKTVQPGTSAAV